MALAAIGLAALGAWAMAQGVDPLTARVDASPAQRFAELFEATGGNPTAAQIEQIYFADGGAAIQLFTPGRIVSAEHLAETVAAKPELYRDAVERCLPWVAGTNAELRATYLGLAGLMPERPLPKIAVVIGANNSGGTAGDGMQVIGLEVICRLSPTHADFDRWMRQFFAHETVHTFQPELSAAAEKDMLLAGALQEGVPDYVAELVTAHVPNPDRDAWARPREAWVWQQFQADAAIVRDDTDSNGDMGKRAQAAFHRWFGNAGKAPDGWPDELGYWVGMRIAEAYVAASPDAHAALDRLIAARDPAAILTSSGYPGGAAQ